MRALGRLGWKPVKGYDGVSVYRHRKTKEEIHVNRTTGTWSLHDRSFGREEGRQLAQGRTVKGLLAYLEAR